MLPTLSWIDFAERDRRRFLAFIDGMNEEDTRDELGIGSVRDAFAELMFPGTSTIQTRARYFLFIPWLYLYRERRVQSGGTKTSIPGIMRDYEIFLIRLLERGGESQGVIGIDARDSLQRLPSTIYWAGLARWDIRRFDMSIAQYHRWLGAATGRTDQVWNDDDGEPVAGYSQQRWDPAIPAPPRDWLQRLTFALTRTEAEYLQERVLASCPATLLAYLLDRTEPVDTTVAYVWMHPEIAAFPPMLRAQIEHARIVSLVMHGAAWLYNLLLTEKQRGIEAGETYREELLRWADDVRQDDYAVVRWDLAEFWSLAREGNPRIGGRTERFVSAWTDCVRRLSAVGHLATIADDTVARQLVAARERELKRGRSRLDNRRLLDLWSGPSGTRRLNYRWTPVVRDIVNDILRGLRESGEDHA